MIDDMLRQNWSTLHSLAIESDASSEGIQESGRLMITRGSEPLWGTVSYCSSRVFGFRVHRRVLHGHDGGGIDSTTVHYLAGREMASLRIWSSVMRASILDTKVGAWPFIICRRPG